MQATDPQHDKADWLRLSLTPGIGPQRLAGLLDHFGLPSRIFSASLAQLGTLVPRTVAQALLAPPAEVQRDVARVLAWAQQDGNSILTLGDDDYPALLQSIPDPPTVLYLKGDPAVLARPCLAMVGSRNATVNGVKTASAFAQAASAAGIAIVSGLALGIDGAAHQGALRGPGSTVAVLATGVDIAYPPRNRALYDAIAAQGCLVSEMPLGTAPLGALFPRRNRIISGLATAVLVVEAAAKSGSLVTARCAASQGRDVMAVPGSIHSTLSKGCHLLIKEGAMLVESIDDVLAAISPGRFVPNAPQGGPDAAMHMPLLARLGFAPTDPADLAVATGESVDSVVSQLLTLELDGHVQRLPGGMFQRLSS